MKLYCCGEHVELALDIIVDDFGTCPVFKKAEGELSTTTCEYCKNPVEYIVGNE